MYFVTLRMVCCSLHAVPRDGSAPPLQSQELRRRRAELHRRNQARRASTAAAQHRLFPDVPEANVYINRNDVYQSVPPTVDGFERHPSLAKSALWAMTGLGLTQDSIEKLRATDSATAKTAYYHDVSHAILGFNSATDPFRPMHGCAVCSTPYAVETGARPRLIPTDSEAL